MLRVWCFVVAGSQVACGPRVLSDVEASSTGTSATAATEASHDPEATIGGATMGGATASAGDDDAPPLPLPRDLPAGTELTGRYLLAVATPIAPETPLQWSADIEQVSLQGGDTELHITLQSLALDLGSTTSPRTPVGTPVDVVVRVDQLGPFTFELTDLAIPGAANPITAGDLTVELVFDGVVQGVERSCGVVTGQILLPLLLDLEGSTFAVAEARDQWPDPVTASCP